MLISFCDCLCKIVPLMYHDLLWKDFYLSNIIFNTKAKRTGAPGKYSGNT